MSTCIDINIDRYEYTYGYKWQWYRDTHCYILKIDMSTYMDINDIDIEIYIVIS
jgi:hypothetical protein